VGRTDLPTGHSLIPVLPTIAEGLLERGWRVSVLSMSADITETWRQRQGRLQVILTPRRRKARQLARDQFRPERRAIAQEISRLDVDLVHAHWTYEYAMAALSTGVPTVVTAHDAPLSVLKHYRDPYRLIRLAMAWRVRRRTQHLTAVSPYLADRWRTEMLWHGEIAVIPNISPFAVPDQPLGKRPGSVVVVSNDDPRKNVRTLLKAWPSVTAEVPEACLRLIGPGLEANGSLALEFTDLEKVEWLGPLDRDSVRQEVESALVLAHPSLEESQGIVLLEAMALGTAVVAGRDSGAVGWTVGNGGVLTDVRQAYAIADSIRLLLTNDDLRSACTSSGVSQVADRFSKDSVCRAYEIEYIKALEVR
jgi:glycosyltransferase involved in cell wall biosynthesis